MISRHFAKFLHKTYVVNTQSCLAKVIHMSTYCLYKPDKNPLLSLNVHSIIILNLIKKILQVYLIITPLTITRISILHGHVLAPKWLFSYCSNINNLIITRFHL